MAKRFTDTERFKDVWYRKLTPVQKCIWEYALSQCDLAGILKFDIDSMSFHIGTDITKTDLAAFNDRFVFIREDIVFIPKFIKFQYGELSENVPTHRAVLKLLNQFEIDYKSPIDRVSIEYCKGINTLQDKDIINNINNKIILNNTSTRTRDKSIDLSFVEVTLSDDFRSWLEYKRERKEVYKSENSVKACYKHLLNLSVGNFDIAKQIIQQSIANNYAGLFELKTSRGSKRNGKPDPYSGKEAPL